MKISVTTIPHKDQRYNTLDDWKVMGRKNSPALGLCVSETGRWEYDALIAIHGLIEAILCEKRGISEKAVSEWDLGHPEAPEPGEMDDCPYRKEHMFAMRIESLLAREMGVNWSEYEKELEAVLCPSEKSR